jgi:beta-lactamase class C
MRLTKSSISLVRQVSRIALALCCVVPGVQASGEKRVTVPIALPFQQQANTSSAGSSSSLAPVQTLQTTAFTQTVAASSVATSVFVATSSVANLAVVTTPVAIPRSSAASSVSVVQAQSKPQTAATTKSSASAKVAASVKTEPVRDIPILTTAPVDAPRYPVGHPEAFIAEFEDYVAKKVAPFVPGVAIVVVSGGQVKSLQGYGVRRAGTREKVTPDTVFRLASLSKAFAATAASELVNEGKITWDTTATSVLPDVVFKNARYGKQLTFGNLLSQASGLPRHTYTHFIDENMSYAEAVRRLRYVDFVCPPGKCFAYQNVSYSLAGDMIKKKSGINFEKYVEQQIFEPLGMITASYGLASYNASPNRAAPHINNGTRWIPTSVTGNWYKVAPAAGVNASIVDMSQFLLGQMGKRQEALPLAVLDPIQSRVTKNTPAQNYYGVRKGVGNTAYGMGLRVFDYGRYKNFIHHGGHVKGFRTEMVFNRDLQIGMVFLSNSETRLARDIIFRFIDSYERAQDAAREARKKK